MTKKYITALKVTLGLGLIAACLTLVGQVTQTGGGGGPTPAGTTGSTNGASNAYPQAQRLEIVNWYDVNGILNGVTNSSNWLVSGNIYCSNLFASNFTAGITNATILNVLTVTNLQAVGTANLVNVSNYLVLSNGLLVSAGNIGLTGVITNDVAFPVGLNLSNSVAGATGSFAGRVQLTNGSFVVAQTNFTTNDAILLTQQWCPGATALTGYLAITNVSASNSFQIISLTNNNVGTGISATAASFSNWVNWVIIRAR